MPSGSARARSTSIVCGKQRVRDEELRRPATVSMRLAWTRYSSVIASAAAVASSSSDAVGDLHPRQIAHHRLEIQERFEAALRDFGLIGRVGRVPPGVLEHVPEDDAGRDAVVVAEADVRLERLVARGERAEIAEDTGARTGRRQSFSGRRSRMRAGIASSISASSEAAPTDLQHALRRRPRSGPMWRDWNELRRRRVRSFHEVRVLRRIQERVASARVARA